MDFFSNLYSKFILRDLLGKVFPGFIFLSGLALFFGLKSHELFHFLTYASLFHYFLIYGISFVIGLLLQFLNPVRLVWRIKRKRNGGDELKKYHEFLVSLRRNEPIVGDPISQTMNAQRERLVVLKDITGNLGNAIFALALFAIYWKVDTGLTGVLFLIAGLLFWESWYHTVEKHYWEELT